MKLIIASLTLILSAQSYAGNLRCVSLDRPIDSVLTISGQVGFGETLKLEAKRNSSAVSAQFQINEIKPSSQYVHINGVATDRMFVGGSSMKLQMLMPIASGEPTLLRIITPGVNLQNKIEEMQLHCQVVNLYQIPPVHPVTSDI